MRFDINSIRQVLCSCFKPLHHICLARAVHGPVLFSIYIYFSANCHFLELGAVCFEFTVVLDVVLGEVCLGVVPVLLGGLVSTVFCEPVVACIMCVASV